MIVHRGPFAGGVKTPAIVPDLDPERGRHPDQVDLHGEARACLTAFRRSSWTERKTVIWISSGTSGPAALGRHLRPEPVFLLELPAEPLEGRFQAQIIEHGRADLEGQGPGALDGLVEECERLFDVFHAAEHGVALHLPEAGPDHGQRLADMIVKVGGDGPAFAFLRQSQFSASGA